MHKKDAVEPQQEKRGRGRPKGVKNKTQTEDKVKPDLRITIFDILNQPPVMTIKEASERFGPSQYAISAAIKNKVILAIQSGCHYEISTWDLVEKFNLFPKELLEQVVERQFREWKNRENSNSELAKEAS